MKNNSRRNFGAGVQNVVKLTSVNCKFSMSISLPGEGKFGHLKSEDHLFYYPHRGSEKFQILQKEDFSWTRKYMVIKLF